MGSYQGDYYHNLLGSNIYKYVLVGAHYRRHALRAFPRVFVCKQTDAGGELVAASLLLPGCRKHTACGLHLDQRFVGFPKKEKVIVSSGLECRPRNTERE